VPGWQVAVMIFRACRVPLLSGDRHWLQDFGSTWPGELATEPQHPQVVFVTSKEPCLSHPLIESRTFLRRWLERWQHGWQAASQEGGGNVFSALI
jgi:hypothetical protein